MEKKNITSRAENFHEWYQDVIKAADLAEHSVVRGSMIIKPWGYAIWEAIQKHLDKKIKDTGHQNVYFPLLIPLRFFEKEANHVEGFAKECAVVTHYRLETNAEGKLVPSPDAVLTEPLVIRPTSETIIGDAMANWVQSYKDLPLLLNQWCNVVRWEMRTRLFLRTSEFLWQEGHTAHATAEEALAESHKMLDVYEDLAMNYLAMPIIKGEKTAAERFPGAVNTYAIEAMMQDGKALQAGTSHFLGQNFSKVCDIKFADKDQKISHAWTSSWGVTTRLIGGLIMTHSDDNGLVLPPRIAPQQIIIIPIIKKTDDPSLIMDYCQDLVRDLNKLSCFGEPIRGTVDISDRQPVEKFWTAVKKGIPVRLEVGAREIESGLLALSRRDQAPRERLSIQREELLSTIEGMLTNIQQQIFDRALKFRQDNTHEITTLSELETLFSTDEDALSGFALAYFDSSLEKEEHVADKLKSLKISTRCIPLDTQTEGTCIFSGKLTKEKVIFAKAY